jgi:cell wall-associated NlpC family hydrolase
MTIRPTAVFLALLALLQTAVAQQAATAPSTRESEIRRGVSMGGSPEERSRRFYEGVIRKIEPSLKGDLSRLPQYLELFKREFVEDVRTFAIDLRATPTPDGVVNVSGRVEFDEHRRALGDLMGALGFATDLSRVELMPLASLGELKFAVVRADRAFVYDKPTAPRETLTESLRGDPLFLLAPAENNHYLCHAADGYVGYVSSDAIERMTGEGFDSEMNPPRAATTDPRVEGAIAEATKLMGTPYVWGGMTKEGVDCSGLVYTAFRSQGLRLPRDADQQALAGKLVATRWHRSSLRRGDTLYFLGRRGTIHHTAIYLGNNEFLEATDPVVSINSFDPAAKNYAKKRDESFCFAKRVFE